MTKEELYDAFMQVYRDQDMVLEAESIAQDYAVSVLEDVREVVNKYSTHNAKPDEMDIWLMFPENLKNEIDSAIVRIRSREAKEKAYTLSELRTKARQYHDEHPQGTGAYTIPETANVPALPGKEEDDKRIHIHKRKPDIHPYRRQPDQGDRVLQARRWLRCGTRP